MNKQVIVIALGGLLHDIGKFMQRAELNTQYPEIQQNYEHFCPQNKFHYYTHLHAAHSAYFIEKILPDFPDSPIDKNIKEELFNAARHHKNPTGDIYKEADRLSSGMERHVDEADDGNFKDVRMHSVFDLIELKYNIRDKNGYINSRWLHRLSPLKSDNSDDLNKTFPVFTESSWMDTNTYENLWDDFQKELNSIKSLDNIKFYFNELYYLIEKYTSCIPSATNTYPDISLFDHAKTTAALASAMFLHQQKETKGSSEFILYCGDLSGIQDYIFNISQAQGVGGIAKRLRGRSFYITMLSEILSRYLVEKLGLTTANINFCGGGNFELLLPNTLDTAQVLTDFETEVNEWLIKEFCGNLGFVGASIEITKEEIRNSFSRKKDELNDLIGISKLRKNQTHLSRNVFWVEEDLTGYISICPSCNMNLLQKDISVCEHCDLDKSIGEFLPKVGFIGFSIGDNLPEVDSLSIDFGRFGRVILWSDNNNVFKSSLKNTTIYSLLDDSSIKALYKISRTMPVALKTLTLDTEEDETGDKTVHRDQPLSFATLADMAQGDKRIGILKMDVDSLGLIISEGLEASSNKDINQNFRSISRLSTLSRQVSNFLSVYLDDICHKVSQNWKIDENNSWQHKENVSGIFYSVFAGGDDLAIVGPWDRTIELAREIRKSFKNFTCHNPNVSLSAGIYMCKPKYPISMAINKAEEALKKAKDCGRNRITVMGETIVWDKEDPKSRVFQAELKSRYPGNMFNENEILSEDIYLRGQKNKVFIKTICFEELYDFAEQLESYYRRKKISRRFIFRLLQGKEQFFISNYDDKSEKTEEKHNFMILPHIFYNIERNVTNDSKDYFKEKLVTSGKAENFLRQAFFPCKYALMKTRNKEG